MKQGLQFAWVMTFLFLPLDLSCFEMLQKAKILLYTSCFEWIGVGPLALHSDSLGFWILCIALPVLFLLIYKFFEKYLALDWSIFMRYLMALVLLKYGMDKMLMQQFMAPEINLLSQKLMHFDKDLLFWTSMGTSAFFNAVVGSLEILTAVLLLYNRSLCFGQTLAVLLFSAIVFINISFDIGVKAFASFLLLGSILLHVKYILLWWNLFISLNSKRSPFVLLKTVCLFAVCGLLLFEGIEKDAYLVQPKQWKVLNHHEFGRIYLNTESFLIFEKNNGERLSFPFLQLPTGTFKIQTGENTMGNVAFHRTENQCSLECLGKRFNLHQEKPAKIEDTFHWIANSSAK